jgi:glycosyltransferase involved in cell wall biosynthesis
MAASHRILYTGSFLFPEGDAAAARVLGIAKALRDTGYEIVMAGGEEKGPNGSRADGFYSYDGFSCWPQGHLSRSGNPLKRLIPFVSAGRSILRWLEGQSDPVAAIIAYDPGSPMLLRLWRYTRAHRIPLVLDLTEWHHGAHLPGGWLGSRSVDNELRMRYLHPHAGHVIGISSYLTEFYRNRGCRVLRVPPLVDLDHPKWRAAPAGAAGPLRLVYAGNPGKKDLLSHIIQGLDLLGSGRQDVELHLVGVMPEQIAAMMSSHRAALARLGPSLVYRSRVPQSRVPEMLSGCDYSVLLRPHRRYAEAGFPTKLVESLSAGLPIITNVTSDIFEYVRDLEEGAIVPDESPAAFAQTVQRVLALPAGRRQYMREKAKERARLSFDYRRYSQQIGHFIAEAIQRRATGNRRQD